MFPDFAVPIELMLVSEKKFRQSNVSFPRKKSPLKYSDRIHTISQKLHLLEILSGWEIRTYNVIERINQGKVIRAI